MNDNNARRRRRNHNQQRNPSNRSSRSNSGNRSRHPARRHAARRPHTDPGRRSESGQNTRRRQKPVEAQAAVSPTATKAAANNQWHWILIAKGIGILLVVIGHFNPSVTPQWYRSLIEVVYSFHMPLFFLLSGFLYVYAKQALGPLILNKLRRLVVPFISIGAIFFAVKWIVGRYATLDHPIGPSSILDLFLSPATSYMPLLWFMHALFLMFIAFVPLRAILRSTSLVMLVVVVLNTVWLPEGVASLHKILAHFPFFIAGIWLRESGQLDLIRKAGWFRIGITCAILFGLIYWFGYSEAVYLDAIAYPIRLALGLLGAMVVITISQRLDLANGRIAKVAGIAGLYSMTIYLLHTLFESGVRIIAFQRLHLGPEYFVVIAITAIAIGMIMPLLLEKYVLRKFGLTRKLILGLS